MKVGFLHLGREHLGITALSAKLKSYGHQIRLYYDPGLFTSEDNVFHSVRFAKFFSRETWLLDQIMHDSPNVLALSVYTSTYRWCVKMAETLRHRGFSGLIVMGGVHVTLAPESALFSSAVDYGMAGETDEAFPLFLDKLATGKEFLDSPNLIYRDLLNNTVINPPMEPIKNLDRLPFPDKELFADELNITDDYLVITGRGCPYSCTYCCESAYNRIYGHKYYRRRSTTSILDELEEGVRRYHSKEVMFFDPVFFTDKRWLAELMEGYRRRIKLRFRCFGRFSLVDEEIINELIRSGCYAVEFGLQTWDERIRSNLLGRQGANEQVRSAMDMFDRLGLHYDVDHIFGLPGETQEHYILAAYEYSKCRMLNRIKCHYLIYFPSLPILKTAESLGEISPDTNAKIERGDIGDFFHQPMTDSMRAKINERYIRLFEILPILPKSFVRFFADRGGIKWMPKFISILLQLLVAIKGKDYRFFVYIRYYYHRVKRHFLIAIKNKKHP